MSATIEGVARAVTLVIGHSLWQSTVVAALLGLVLAAMRRSSANARYAASCVALALALALPVLTGVVTDAAKSEVPGVRGTVLMPLPSRVATPTTLSHVATSTAPSQQPTEWAVRVKEWLWAVFGGARDWIFAAWLLGVALLTALHLSGYRRVCWLRASALGAPSGWQPLADSIGAALGLARRVRVTCSQHVDVPAVVGWLSPVVLMPASAVTGMSVDDLRLLVAHELAHVRRHDYAVNLLQVVAETLFFYHPAVWWMSRRIREEREHCCDDLAVAVCGDRIEYARALVRMEELRALGPEFAMRADGGSLAARIRRLTGGYAMNTTSAGARMGALAAVAVIVAGLFVAVAPGPRAQGGEKHYTTQTDQFDVEGRWALDYRTDRGAYIRFGLDHDRMNITTDIDKSDFTGLDSGEGREFELHRPAGTIYLRGDVDTGGKRARGDGDFGFVADRGYAKALGERVEGSFEDEELFLLAVENVTIGFADEMIDLGYKDIESDQLIAMAIHGVTPEFARAVKDRGVDADIDDLVSMRIHDVTEEFMDEMRAEGMKYRGADDLVSWRIHEVTPAFVKAMMALKLQGMDPEDFVSMRIHDVTPEFARAMQKQFGAVDVDELLSMKIHDVSEAYIRALAAAGYADLTVDDLTSWKIHGVSDGFIEEMKGLGYGHLDSDQLIAFRIHNVTPEFVRELNELGYQDVDPDDLVAMRIHDVTPKFIRSLKDKGYPDLSIEDLIKIKIHSIRL